MAYDWQVFHFDEVSSTQDAAKEKVIEGQPGAFVVCANRQTSGRGRMGRSWVSLDGNLQSTLAIPLTFDLSMASHFSFLMAVALSEAIVNACHQNSLPKIEHKWPNDVWVNDRKMAGILIELKKDYLLIGVGVNIVYAPDDAIALNAFSHHHIDAQEFQNDFLIQVNKQIDLFFSCGFAPIRQAWLDRARGVGQKITVRVSPSDQFCGVFDGLEKNGALRVLVEGEQKPRIVTAGDVFFGRDGDINAACG